MQAGDFSDGFATPIELPEESDQDTPKLPSGFLHHDRLPNDRNEVLNGSTGKYRSVSTNGCLAVHINSHTPSYKDTGALLPPYHQLPYDRDLDESPSDNASEAKGSSALFSTPQTSPRPSVASASASFSPKQSNNGSEAPSERIEEFLGESAFQTKQSRDISEVHVNGNRDLERPYTSSLGVPDHWERSHALELSVISDAGDQQHKRQRRAIDDEESTSQGRKAHEEQRQVHDRVDSPPPYLYALQSEIFNALEQTRNPNIFQPESGFLPKAQLCRLVNEDSVYLELTRHLSQFHTPEQIKSYASAVCKETEVTRAGKRKIKSFQKIFALLVLTETSSSISMFLEGAEDLSDLDLPLTALGNRGTIELRRRDSAGQPSSEPLKCFSHHIWSPAKLINFEKYQWTMLAPFFSPEVSGDIKHYLLQDQHILPFVASQEATDDDVEYHGGFGKVFMVYIHPEHRNFRDEHLCNRGFAIKQLYERDPDAFKREVNILKKFSGKRSHPHVVSLLATYEQFKKFHLIFYRAEGDLFKYWKEIEPSPDLDYGSVLWMATQCAGIADGLLRLHRHLTFSSICHIDTDDELPRKPTSGKHVKIVVPGIRREQKVTQSSGQDEGQPGSPIIAEGRLCHHVDVRPKPIHKPQSEELVQIEKFGRHGDINPGNILWYDEPHEKGVHEKTRVLKGTLKLSDFGQAELNSQASRSKPRDVANTMTYRPPECDLQPKIIRQSYDIWCMGCVYLEFVAWILGGARLLIIFGRNRKTRDPFQYNQETDTFFQIVINPDTGLPEVMVKPAVIKFITYLHQHPKCTEYMHELLDMIENNMLVVESSDRKPCNVVWQSLDTMRQKCLKDENYATKANPWTIPRTTTEPLAHSVKVNMEGAAERIIAENISVPPITPSRPGSIGRRNRVGDSHDGCLL